MRHNTPEQFAYQLREGHYNELRVALYFMLQGAHVRIGYTSQRYDLSVILPKTPRFSVEVKWDKRAGETGNLYFEIKNTRRDEPSGIAATTADFWCHVIGEGNEALLAATSRLRKLLRSKKLRRVETKAEDGNSLGLLAPRAWLEAQEGVVWIALPTVEGFFGELFRK
ncbi:MAG TPA: hypothetical protein EYP25_07420 [Anaerolineae bacterium]|nr:hypothetical protein [Caldilineae bacterium]HID34384.1 hypothetical protein [Anaerolineae bacterium]HIQ11666.1 hypothetical protein [Caldilineales bacterium]